MRQITESELKQIKTEFNKRKKNIGLSGYNIGEYLTEGGTAKIYLVKNSFSLKQYVIRISEEIQSPYSDESYNEREVRIQEELKRSNQPHIVSYLDSFMVKATGPYHITPYYCAIMELLIPLKKTRGGDGREIAVRLGNDLLPLLQTLWDKKIIHRDIKPENIFYDKDFRNRKGFMLGDFGIARKDSETSITDAGTGSTKAPEIAGIDSALEGNKMRSDMYSLGMVMYYYLNECIYPSNHTRLSNNPDKSPFPLPRYGSRKLKNLVLKATQYNPEDRFSSPQEMLRELQSCEEYRQFIESADSDNEETRIPIQTAMDRITRLQAENEALQKEAAQRNQELMAEIEMWREKYSRKESELESVRQHGNSPQEWQRPYGRRAPEPNHTYQSSNDAADNSQEQRPTGRRLLGCSYSQANASCVEVKVGSLVTFGKYPTGTNGELMPIEWRVLDIQGNMALLITEKLIDCRKYNDTAQPVTWENCTLRRWLNRVFINRAFSEKSRARIITVTNTNPGIITNDRVFLLSTDQAEQYFSSNQERMAAVTLYARQQGSHTSDKCSLPNGDKTGWWWLRSSGGSSTSAVHVNIYGNISTSGSNIDRSNGSVRPALWVRI